MPDHRCSAATFAIRTDRTDAATTLHLSGELDLTGWGAAAAAFAQADLSACLQCVVDLRALQFMDAGGVRLLWKLRERADADGFPLLVMAPDSGPIARVLKLCGDGGRDADLAALPAA